MKNAHWTSEQILDHGSTEYRMGNCSVNSGWQRRSRDSSVVWAPDSWLKGCRFESLQERRESFLFHGQLSVLTLISVSSSTLVTAVACKRSQSFCQKCRWQVTAKHTCTLRMSLCMKWQGAWLYGVHRSRWDGSSFMWHEPCQSCKYTTSVDIQKRAIKS